jgi:hypothetical protein
MNESNARSNEPSAADLLSRREAAKYLDVRPGTLANWAYKGNFSLPVVYIGRLAKYRKSDLDNYIRRHTRDELGVALASTAETSA